MNRSSATVMALLVVIGPMASMASAGEPACRGLQRDLDERDQEIARHRQFSTELFKQLKAAQTELESAERANDETRAQASAASPRAPRESMGSESSHEEELVASLRTQVTKLEAALAGAKAERDGAVAQRDALLRNWKEQARTGPVRPAVVNIAPSSADERSQTSAAEQVAVLRSKLERIAIATVQDRKEREERQENLARLEQENERLAAELADAIKARDAAIAKPRAIVSQGQGQTAQLEEAGIKKWEQPDGSLFFGERPRPGSTLLVK
jgi:hypothetical protein